MDANETVSVSKVGGEISYLESFRAEPSARLDESVFGYSNHTNEKQT